MLYREIIAVCSHIHTKHINTSVWAERGIFGSQTSSFSHQSLIMKGRTFMEIHNIIQTLYSTVIQR